VTPRMPRAVAVCLAAAAIAAAWSAGCTGDDVVVYRMHAVVSAAGGAPGEPEATGGSTPAPSGGGAGGARPPGAPGGSGGRDVAPDAAVPMNTGGTGAVPASGGAGGAPATGGSGGAAPAGGGGSSLPGSCTTSSDCMSGWMCVKLDCTAARGVCQPHPLACDVASLPVCGCDGITYWNDCYRQLSGVAARAFTQCASAMTCDTAADCKVAGASCAHLSFNPVQEPSCAAPGSGACWVVPADCAGTAAAPLWTSCDPQQPPGARPCMNTCAAIRSGQPVVTAMPGMQCR